MVLVKSINQTRQDYHFLYRRYFRAEVCRQGPCKPNEASRSCHLRIQQTDETTMKAVQLFARQVVLILHTCNDKEYWAALKRLESPTTQDGSKNRDCSIIYPHVGSVIGWFAGYRAAVVRTKQGKNVVMS